uniref:Ig-like domain-containing protein n=1 Tax=Gouania willdenowi TaxID=441366 RepID=A0A8C5NAG9_GOUWI
MDVFGGAPRFLAYPRPVVVQSGTDAVLKCQIGGDPRPAVIWERNNEKIHPEGRYRVFEDGNVYNLIISAVNTEDSGQYICKAKNSIGETYAAATLKNKPRFLIKPLSTRVGRGEDAVFSCKLWGNPKPEVIWEKDGKKLNEIFESTHFNVGYQDGGWFQLKIFKARAPDGGVYTCKARNEFGESCGRQMFAVTEGKHAKFRCFVTGKPKPEIIWRKDGRLILHVFILIHCLTKQGILLSPLLFALAIEPLMIAIRSNPKITGIHRLRMEAKVSLYADDLLLYVSDINTSIPVPLRQLVCQQLTSLIAMFKNNEHLIEA